MGNQQTQLNKLQIERYNHQAIIRERQRDIYNLTQTIRLFERNNSNLTPVTRRCVERNIKQQQDTINQSKQAIRLLNQQIRREQFKEFRAKRRLIQQNKRSFHK